MARLAVSTVMLCALGGSAAAAQDCLGFVPFQNHPVHFFLRGSFSDPQNLYGGGLAVGGRAAFGELDVEGVSTGDLGAAAFTVGAGGGLQLPMSRGGTAHLCPIAAVSFALGPNNVYDSGVHYREADYTFGAAFGLSATGADHQLKLIPTASFAWTYAHNRFTDPNGTLLSAHSRSLRIVDVGVGILIGREVSITPTISHVSAGSTSTAFGVRFAFALGGTRTAFVNTRATGCAGLTTADSTVYDTTQVTERPTIRTAPELNYPPMQRDLLIRGRVILGVTIGSDGVPDTVSLEVLNRIDPALDHEAVRWLEGAKYWPACRDGRPVRVRIAQPVDFCIAGCPRRKT